MDNTETLKAQVKQLLAENLMLQVPPEQIADTQPLFGPNGLGFDSVDALQLVVALDKNYGLKIPNPEVARQTLATVESIATALRDHLARRASDPIGSSGP